ncbi:MAG: hypothetical protein AB4042_18380 [Leptolyngbyaceae cyanobacterium]
MGSSLEGTAWAIALSESVVSLQDEVALASASNSIATATFVRTIL